MKRVKLSIRQLTLLLLLSSCFSCVKNNSLLGNGYFLLSDHESIDIGYPYGSTVYWSPSGPDNLSYRLVSADIINCWHDNDFIIVQQKINLTLLKARISDGIVRAYKYEEIDSVDVIFKKVEKQTFRKDFNFLEKEQNIRVRAGIIADSLLNNNEYFISRTNQTYNYYIINKKEKTISNPLSLTEMRSNVKKNKI